MCDEVNEEDAVHQVDKVDEVHQVHQVDLAHEVNKVDEVHLFFSLEPSIRAMTSALYKTVRKLSR